MRNAAAHDHTTDTDVYLSGDEPMRRPDHKAKKHGRPMPVRYKRSCRQKWQGPYPDPAGENWDHDPRGNAKGAF